MLSPFCRLPENSSKVKRGNLRYRVIKRNNLEFVVTRLFKIGGNAELIHFVLVLGGMGRFLFILIGGKEYGRRKDEL